MTMNRPRVDGTSRIEAFSDGVVAIIVTLLIFEVRLPAVAEHASNQEMADAFLAIAPKLLSFAVSFFTVAIFWVNHHHFFVRVTHTDWKLLWANNLLLFFLSIVPFTTAVLGDHFNQPVAVAVYAINLGLAGTAFSLMGWYVLYVGRLVDPAIPEAERKREFRRSLVGSTLYLAAAPIAFFVLPLSLVLFVVLPISYIVPSLFGGADE